MRILIYISVLSNSGKVHEYFRFLNKRDIVCRNVFPIPIREGIRFPKHRLVFAAKEERLGLCILFPENNPKKFQRKTGSFRPAQF